MLFTVGLCVLPVCTVCAFYRRDLCLLRLLHLLGPRCGHNVEAIVGRLRSSADASGAMATLSVTTPKTRQGLSLSERIKVIEARQMGKSMRQLAAQFHCGKTQILNTLAQKERYLHEWYLLGGCNNPSIGARKRFRHTRNEQINSSVHEWYHQQKSLGIRITGPMLQRQARHTAAQLGITNFAASNGWLANFRRFYNIVNLKSDLVATNQI